MSLEYWSQHLKFSNLKSILKPENIDNIIPALLRAAQIFLRINASQSYSPQEHLDAEEPVSHEMQDGLRTVSPRVANIAHCQNRNATEEEKFVRDQFMVYFNTNGTFLWQDAYT